MLGRILFVFSIGALIILGALGLNFLFEEPGSVTLEFREREYPLSLFEAAVLLVLVVLAAMLAITLLRVLIAVLRFLITGDSGSLGNFFTQRRRRKGLEALSTAMVALAAGDAKTAQRKAELAEQKLKQPELTRLLNAQAADLAGEVSQALILARTSRRSSSS